MENSTILEQDQGIKKSEPVGCVSSLVFLLPLSAIWLGGLLRHLIIFMSTTSPTAQARWSGLGSGLVFFLLLVPLLVLLARFWPVGRFKIIYQALLLALLLTPLLLLAMGIAFYDNQARMLAQIILSAIWIIAILVWDVFRLRGLKPSDKPDANPVQQIDLSGWQDLPETPASGAQALFETAAHPGRAAEPLDDRTLDQPLLRWLTAVGIGLVALLPWANYGALGSILDTLLGIVLAFTLAFGTAFVCERFLFAPLRRTHAARSADFLLGGVTSLLILILIITATIFSFSGLQTLLWIAIPSFGFSLAGLNILFPGPSSPEPWRASLGRILPYTLMIGLALSGPFVWFDPDELVLVLGMDTTEVVAWATRAAFINLFTALVTFLIFSILLYLTSRRLHALQPKPVRISCMGVLLIALVITGIWSLNVNRNDQQAGTHGERLFVIMEGQADLSAAAETTDPGERRRFVYQNLVEHAVDSQANLRQSLDKLGIDYTPYYLVNALEVQADPLLKVWLNLHPDVDRIIASPRLRPLPVRFQRNDPGNEFFGNQLPWNLRMIGADRVWQDFGARGQGIVVGQSDSGVQADHPEISDGYRGWAQGNDRSWLDPWFGQTQPYDVGGHGTHTLGTVLGNKTGVAPDATWFACSNLVRNLGNPALYLDCWQFMLAPHPGTGDPFSDGDPLLGANVLNNSWGCPDIEGCDLNTFQSAAQALKAAGVFVVVSAGNDGPACGSLTAPPAVYDEVFSVGAIDRYGELASFSSIGPVVDGEITRIKPDILAPGVSVPSSMPLNGYASNSGTSMAGPHVVGVVALMWSANPALIGQVDATTEILRQTATPYEGTLPDCPGSNDYPSTATGYGVVDAYAAVQAAIAWQP